MTFGKRKHIGDRIDAKQRTGLDSMHVIMPGMMPNRCDNEAFIQETVRVDALEKWLREKNEKQPAHHYTYFHAMVAAIARTFQMRPKMNRFIKGCRYYERNDISFAFVAKREFSDHASEGVAIMCYDPAGEKSSIDEMHDKITDYVYGLREKKQSDSSTDTMDFLTKMPKPMVYRLMRILAWMDDRGIMPKSLSVDDPYACSVFISNIGSLGMRAGYHHLSNWGTNSVFVLMGQKYTAPDPVNGGEMQAIDIGITLDERIADGYYFSKTVRILKHLIENPELLDTPCREELTFDA